MSFSDETQRASEESLATVETVRSILTSKGGDVWWVAPSATVYEAIAMMADKRVGALLVLDGERLAGIISERDYARKVFLKGRSSRDTLVSEIMTSEVITAEPVLYGPPMHARDDCPPRAPSAGIGAGSRGGYDLHRRPGELDHLRASRNHPALAELRHRRVSALALGRAAYLLLRRRKYSATASA